MRYPLNVLAGLVLASVLAPHPGVTQPESPTPTTLERYFIVFFTEPSGVRKEAGEVLLTILPGANDQSECQRLLFEGVDGRRAIAFFRGRRDGWPTRASIILPLTREWIYMDSSDDDVLWASFLDPTELKSHGDLSAAEHDAIVLIVQQTRFFVAGVILGGP